MLTEHSIYIGTISSVDLVTRTMTVIVNNQTLLNCRYAAGVLAEYLGFSNIEIPSVGSSVLVFYVSSSSSSYVIGTNPITMPPSTAFPGVAAGDVDTQALKSECLKTKGGKAGIAAPGVPFAADMLPGEHSVENGIGVLLRMLMNFAQLSSGGLAMVETHLLNDMVRIVSNYFVHHNVGGDDLIWSNGRNNSESHFTSYPFEAEGKLTADAPMAVMAGDHVADPVKSCKNPFSDTGRWRKSTYVGFLADMLHTWITDPTATISNFMEGAHRAGHCRIWAGADGTIMVQTDKAIHMEVNPEIVIPQIHYNWNDPEFDAEKAMEDLNNSYLKVWGKGPDWKDLNVAVWQMRSYARYIVLWHSLSRWHQMAEKNYCKVPTETEAGTASMVSCEEDKAQANGLPTEGPTKVPTAGTASISILQDGSISVRQGHSTSVILNKGCIQINAVNNLELCAGNNLTLTARNVTIKSLDHIEIASLAGAIYMKARTAIHALCEKGRIWLKSDAKSGSKDAGVWPADGGERPSAEMEDCGVILDATQSKTLVHGARGVVADATGPGSYLELQASGAGGEVRIYGSLVKVWAKMKYLLKTLNLGWKATIAKLAASDFKIGEELRVSPSSVEVKDFVRAKMLISEGVQISPIEKNVPPESEEDTVPVMESTADAIEEELDAIKNSGMPYKTMDNELGKYNWTFRKWVLGDDVSLWDSLKATPTVDTASADPQWIKSWAWEINWDLCKPLPAPRTNTRNRPWPGNNLHFEYECDDMPPLSYIMDRQFKEEDIKGIGEMKLKPYRFFVVKSFEELAEGQK